MSTYDAQIHCSGVQKVLNDPKSFSRELKFVNEGAFFPCRSDSGLGFDFACYSYFACLVAGPRASGGWRVCPRSIALKKLCRAKTDALAGLRESLEQGMCYQPT